jgi:hypothetical protein
VAAASACVAFADASNDAHAPAQTHGPCHLTVPASFHTMAFVLRRRSLTRLVVGGIAAVVLVRLFVWPSSPSSREPPQIKQHGVLDLVTLSSGLDVQRHDFLQVRIGRDERPDILDAYVYNGMNDYWERFQKP